MKIAIALVITLSLFTTSVAVFATHSDETSVRTYTVKEKNLFVFNVNKNWRGANVEITASNGDRVTSQKLVKRKMVISFRNVKSGTYKIKISKDNRTEVFEYTKN